MTLEPVGLHWNADTHQLVVRHCRTTWWVRVGSIFLRLRTRCPVCGAAGALEPDQLVALFEKFSPSLPCALADQRDAEAAERTIGWYRDLAGFERIGECAEYAVFPIFLSL